MWNELSASVRKGMHRGIARAISLLENDVPGSRQLLEGAPAKLCPVIGVTGPPGAGKSTLTDALIRYWIEKGERIAVCCVDPSSPFTRGALLGDRIRMSQWQYEPNVFIRSLASRGSLGGLHPRIVEITELLQRANFNRIIVETVGVGQSEVNIAGLADITLVVLVPEAGDEVQTMKAGLMEIADLFVVNKADRPDADRFVHHLNQMLHPASSKTSRHIPVLKTSATAQTGIDQLAAAIEEALLIKDNAHDRAQLLAEKAYQLICDKRMKDVSIPALKEKILLQLRSGDFQLFSFIKDY